MIKNIILFILLEFFLIGCTHNRIDKRSYVITKDAYGNVKSEINYINDTLMDGVAKYYYRNKKLKDEIYFTNGLKNGLHKHYTEEGRLESIIGFKEGLQEGYTYWYYPNGKIESKSFWLKGKIFGDAYYYYKTGILESYRSFDFQMHNRYLIKYDSSGLKIKEDGNILGQFLLDGNFDSVRVNKPFVARISVALPPDHTVNVYIGMLIKNKLTDSVSLPIQNNIATYKQTFTEKGRLTLATIGELKDINGNIVKLDTIYSKINVTE
jgi:hypothetical protein